MMRIIMPNFTLGAVIDNAFPTAPYMFGGIEAAASPLGDRVFFGFYKSNNVGMLEAPTAPTPGALTAATDCRAGCPPTCTGPGVRDVVYTPYHDKVYASIWWNTQAESKLLIVNAAAILPGKTGLPSYTRSNQAGVIGPEGLAVSPLFDRDSDRISDLIEARNICPVCVNFHPTVFDGDSSGRNGCGITLPEEGMGYYHFYGGDAAGGNLDNWGSMELLKTIEQVGREWNLHHSNGPRIGIADMSLLGGGLFRPHNLHQTGIDVDVRYPRNDRVEDRCDVNDANFSSAMTQELLEVFCATGMIDLIYVGTQLAFNQIQGCTISRLANHNDHFHVRIDQ